MAHNVHAVNAVSEKSILRGGKDISKISFQES